MIRRIWNKFDEDIVLVVIALAVVGVVGGILYVLNTYKVEEVGCTSEAMSLPSPTTPNLILDAVDLMVDARVVASRDVAMEELQGAQWVFDPEEHDLEYWLIFNGVAAEFNFTCPLELENFPLDLEYEGSRGL